jgi:hypothetical protein
MRNALTDAGGVPATDTHVDMIGPKGTWALVESTNATLFPALGQSVALLISTLDAPVTHFTKMPSISGLAPGSAMTDDQHRLVAAVATPAALNATTPQTVIMSTTTGAITLVTADSVGGPVNGLSNQVDLTPDGNYVAFDTTGTGLYSPDLNGSSDIFLRRL